MPKDTLVKIEDLVIDFKTEEGKIRAVNGVSFEIKKGKILGLVGESGSGKSATALSLIRLIPSPAGKIKSGRILFENKNILDLSNKEIQKIRGKKISMIFQEPMTSLNPVFTVGEQISEVLIVHEKLKKKEAIKKSIHIMDQVGIPRPKERIHSYPHELSGGQRQRVMIAMAIACEPTLLIADEPTTALDVTIQKQILNLLSSLQEKYDMSILFISHDLGVIAEISDHVAVMYEGKIVENESCQKIFKSARHPYTQCLISCRPDLEKNLNRLPMMSDFLIKKEDPSNGKDTFEKITHREHEKKEKKDKKKKSNSRVILEIKNLNKRFSVKKSFFGKTKTWLQAVENVSFQIQKGFTLGLVGESGCGKTTLGRIILRLIEPSSGEIYYQGKDITKINNKTLRSKMQMIFQDPFASLNPRMTVGEAINEPMKVHKIGENKKERIDRAAQLLERCGLKAHMLNRYPHEFSGGQKQRICIARALSVEPEFIVCDESVSALDVSVQAQILNLLLDLQEERNLTYIFISHDLAVVRFIADEVAVMHDGRIVEKALSDRIYKSPKHAYTKKLINAIPKGIPKESKN